MSNAYRLVLHPTLHSCSSQPLPACFTSEQSTVEAPLFVNFSASEGQTRDYRSLKGTECQHTCKVKLSSTLQALPGIAGDKKYGNAIHGGR